MKITIIGWYGTETIGDRAILAGIISILNESYDNFEIKLGSLYPFFSERTLSEDYDFYKEIIGKDIKIDIFNSKNSKELSNSIKDSDLLIMGGGPLMDLDELFMIEYAFRKAKKIGVKTALLGCGVGPLFNKKYRRSVLNIFLNSDIIILRDEKSKEKLKEIYKEFNKSFCEDLIFVSWDPSVECILQFDELYQYNEQEYIAVNLREFPLEYCDGENLKNINQGLENFVQSLSDKFPNREIRLIPMHYFHVGGDDRVFLNKIALKLQKDNIVVQNSNLTLAETMQVYKDAYFNVGMRFHSVVFQTMLSGKNYILDYTEPKSGKIFSFLRDVDEDNFYDNKYISLQEDEITGNIIQESCEKYSYDKNKIKKKRNIYIEKLKE